MPLVSIIIPHFNRSKLLSDTVASVQRQTFSDWELIIVDDGSDEGERMAINIFADHDKIKVTDRMNRIKGPSSCRNQGVSLSSGKYIIFLDSDDLLAPYCLQQRVEEMRSSPEISLGVFLMEEFQTTPGDSGKLYNQDISPDDWGANFLQGNNPWNVTCSFWTRSFFDAVGGFDETLLYMEDPELHIRAINQSAHKIKTFYKRPADSYYRIHFMDHTKKQFNYNSIFYRLAFFKKITGESGKKFVEENRKSIRQGIYNMIRTFLYSRKNQFPELYQQTLDLMRNSQLFSHWEIFRFSFLITAGNSENPLLKKMRLRGLCYKLLP